MSTTSNFLQHFFGDQACGQLFVGTNYSGTNYERRLKDHTNVAQIENELLYQVMTHGHNDGSLRKEFVDFVVLMARTHKGLDESKSLLHNTLLQNVVDKFTQSIIIFVEEVASSADLGNFVYNNIGVDRTKDSATIQYLENSGACDTPLKYILYAATVSSTTDAIYKVTNDMSLSNALTTVAQKMADKCVADASVIIATVAARATTNSNPLSDSFKSELNTTLATKLRELALHYRNTLVPATSSATMAPTISRAFDLDKTELAKAVAREAVNAVASRAFVSPHVGASGSAKHLLDALMRHKDPAELKLFNALCMLLKQDNSNGWVHVPLEAYDTTKAGDFRVNLKKDQQGGTKILFATTLPKVKKGASAYYTTNSGDGSDRMDSEDYLCDLYTKVYTGASDSAKYRGSADSKFHSKVYDNDVLEKLLKSQVNLSRDYGNVSYENQFKTPLDEYFQEISGNQMWFRKGSKLYKRHPDGTEEAFDASTMKIDGCKGTGLTDNGTHCKSVLQCIADGANKELGICLEAFKNHDLWKKASEDAEVHPQMAVFVLKKLGFGGRYVQHSHHGKIKVPQDVEQWIENTKNQNPEAMKAVSGNENMKQYLKGLVSFLKSNPAILNKDRDMVHVGHIDSRPDEIKHLGISALIPHSNQRDNYRYTAALLRNMPRIIAPQLGVHFGDRYLEVPNGHFGSFMSGVNMGGGAYYHHGGDLSTDKLSRAITRDGGQAACARTYRAMMNNVKHELEAVGHHLDEHDDSKIMQAIDNLEALENKLGPLHNALNVFVESATAYGFRHRTASHKTRNVSISDVKDAESTRDYLMGNIEELKRAINNNAQLQANIGNELVGNVIPQLLEELDSRTNHQ